MADLKQRIKPGANRLQSWKLTGVYVGEHTCSDHLLTILVHGVRLRLLLANIGEGTYNGDAVGQFLMVLVVVLFEQGFANSYPGILTQRARCLVLIQNHVCATKQNHYILVHLH